MSLDRRSFLLAAPAAAALAADGPRQRPIRVAVYGLGHGHARAKVATLRAMHEYELVGLCEPARPDLLALPDYAGLPRLDARRMLDDPSIETIAVESDVRPNLGYAREAVDAGKHVHLDKPPGDDLAALRTLLADAGRRGLHVQMGYMWRYHVAMNEAIRLARSGALGRVHAVRAAIDKPLGPSERRELAVFRGGILFELGCHLIDRVVDLLGEPKRASGLLRHDSAIGDGLADNTIALLEYDRALAQIEVAAMQPNGNAYRTFQIRGDRGTATVQPFSPDGGLHLDLAEPAGGFPAGPHRAALAIPKLRGPYERDFVQLARQIRQGAAPDYSAEHDLIVQRVLLEVCGMAAS